VAQQPGDHGGDFGGGAASELRVNTDGFALDVPVDEYTGPTIAGMPFGHQILIPGGVFLGVGGAGSGAFTPDVRPSHAEDGIGHVGNRCS
jgi:hypothetical protein